MRLSLVVQSILLRRLMTFAADNALDIKKLTTSSRHGHRCYDRPVQLALSIYLFIHLFIHLLYSCCSIVVRSVTFFFFLGGGGRGALVS